LGAGVHLYGFINFDEVAKSRKYASIVIAAKQTLSQFVKTVIPDRPGAAGFDLESSFCQAIHILLDPGSRHAVRDLAGMTNFDTVWKNGIPVFQLFMDAGSRTKSFLFTIPSIFTSPAFYHPAQCGRFALRPGWVMMGRIEGLRGKRYECEYRPGRPEGRQAPEEVDDMRVRNRMISCESKVLRN